MCSASIRSAWKPRSQWAYQLATLEFYGLDRSYIDDYGNKLAAVSLDDAKRVVNEVIPTSQQLVLVVIGKADAIRDGLRNTARSPK